MADNSLDVLLCYRWDTTGAASLQYTDTKVTKGICNACKTQRKALLCPLVAAASFQQNNTSLRLKEALSSVRMKAGENSLLVNYMVFVVRAKTPQNM